MLSRSKTILLLMLVIKSGTERALSDKGIFDHEKKLFLDQIRSDVSISSIAAGRRRNNCNYDGVDLLQTMNHHFIEFDQSVYIIDDLSVNTPVGTSILKLSAVYNGHRRKQSMLKYNISSSDDTFKLSHLHSTGKTSLYTLLVNRSIVVYIECHYDSAECWFDLKNNFGLATTPRYEQDLKGKLSYSVNYQHRYQFKLEAYSPNQPSLYSKAWVQITLRNHNCHAPMFVSDLSFWVSEIAESKHIVGVVQAVDKDNDVVHYEQKNMFDKYEVDRTTGVIYVKDKLITDSDIHIKFHELIIEAVDDASSCKSTNIQCNPLRNETLVKIYITEVNMESPRFDSDLCNQSIEIIEHMDISNPIVTLSAVDNDRAENGYIEFSFPDAASSKNNAYQKFRLDAHPQRGNRRNVSIYATESFDYDAPHAINTFFLLVFAQDSGSHRRQGFCFLKISITDKNDNPPIFVVTRWKYQLKNTFSTDGHQRLFRVIASDKDSGRNGQVSYFLTKPNEYFDVEQETGFIYLKNASNIGEVTSQQFEVYATDGGIISNQSKENATVIITLSDSDNAELVWVNEDFNDFSVNISEKFHSKYAMANIHDSNFDGNIAFFGYGAIMNPRFQLMPRPEDALFVATKTKIEKTQGMNAGTKFSSGIRVTNELDAEVKDKHYLYLRVQDIQGSQSLVGLCRVNLLDENDQIPFFDSSELHISLLEGNWSSLEIGQVQAFDQDITYPNNYVRYRLRHGESDEIRKMFSVRETGEIIAHGFFDREKQGSWNFYIESYDGANGYGLNEPNSDSIAVRIDVIDVNDNSPRFSEDEISVDIAELFQPGQSVIQLECVDPDFDSFLQFHIISGNEDGKFAVRKLVKSPDISIAEIYIVGALNYFEKPQYKLRLYASDSLNHDEILIRINLHESNCKPPIFSDIYQTNIVENVVAHNLFVFEATDKNGNDIELNIVDRHKYPQFKLVDKRLSLVKGLDRDLPFGKPFYIVPIRAFDGTLFTFTNVNITVVDVNDNPPSLITDNALIMYENQHRPSIHFRIGDVDDWTLGHGGPFKPPTILNTSFGSVRNFMIGVSRRNSLPFYILTYIGDKFDRESSPKNFTVELNVQDAKGLTGRIYVPIVIGDRNDNNHFDGEKSIFVFRYLPHIKCLSSRYIGDVYVEDADDWDRTEKTFANLPENKFFDIDRFGRININPKTSKLLENGKYEFKISAFDRMYGTSVTGIVDVTITDVHERDVHNAVNIHLKGFNAKSFLKLSSNKNSQLNYFMSNVSLWLNTESKYVFVVNVQEITTNDIEIYLFVRGMTKGQVEHQLRKAVIKQRYFDIISISKNPCDHNSCPSYSYCHPTRLVNSVDFNLIDTNSTSSAFLNVRDVADCVCYNYFNIASRPTKDCSATGGWCRNGGRCKEGVDGHFTCDCPYGFDGPRCEALERSFDKNGFAKFKGLDSCEPSRLHLEFSSMSEAKAGLLLLSGDPLTSEESQKFFTAIQIVNGSLLVHLGKDAVVRLGDDMVVDGFWHHVDIEQIAKVTLDQCESKTIRVNKNSRMSTTENHAMFIGGLPQRLRVQDVFRDVLAVHEYDGCIRNVMINGHYLDMFIPANLEGSQYKDSKTGQCPCRHHIYCDVSMIPRALIPYIPWWIWIMILAIIFILTASLSITLVSFVRRRNDRFLRKCYSDQDKISNRYIDEEDDAMRENLISYVDGAGEQDQTSFDLKLLQKPVDYFKEYHKLPNPTKTTNIQDSYLVFDNEGNEISYAGSELSSISCSTLPDLNFKCSRQSVERLRELFDSDNEASFQSHQFNLKCNNGICNQFESNI